MPREPAIFVVEEDHVIRYAGTKFGLAVGAVRGNNRIKVWRDGFWLGDVTFDGVWIFKTKYWGEHPIHIEPKDKD